MTFQPGFDKFLHFGRGICIEAAFEFVDFPESGGRPKREGKSGTIRRKHPVDEGVPVADFRGIARDAVPLLFAFIDKTCGARDGFDFSGNARQGRVEEMISRQFVRLD